MNIPVKFKQGILIGSFATDPDGYDEGQIYWNTTDKKFRQYNGTVWADLKEPFPALETGTVISFANPLIYNTDLAPATGNITNDLTGARQGLVQKIYHNHTTAPTVPADWVLVGGGVYVESVLNIIYAEFAGGLRVEYWITQQA